jgi:hypothetical protein
VLVLFAVVGSYFFERGIWCRWGGGEGGVWGLLLVCGAVPTLSLVIWQWPDNGRCVGGEGGVGDFAGFCLFTVATLSLGDGQRLSLELRWPQPPPFQYNCSQPPPPKGTSAPSAA